MGCSASKEEVPIKTTEPLKNEPASEPQFIKTNVLNKEEDAKVVEILNHLPSPTKHTLEPLSSLSSQTSSIQGSKLAPIVRKGDNLEKSVLPEIGKKSIGKSLPSLVHEATITNSVQNSQEVDYDSQELPAHDTPAHSPAEKDWLSEIEEFVKTETRPSWYNNAVNAAEKAKLKELSPYEKAGNRAINEDVEQSSTDALEDLILLGYLEKLQ